MNRFYKSSITIFAAILFFYLDEVQLESAQATAPTYVESPSTPSEQTTYLDLTYVYGGDFILGQPFDEEEITQKILSSPNLIELNLSGQIISPDIMSIIHDNLSQLKKLTIKGSVRFNHGDGLFYSWESINQQIVSQEMLQSLFSNDSAIEILDLSLTTIDDRGLVQISQSAHNLREIYLIGASGITDRGIVSLVDKLPNLKLIDLSSYILRKPMADQETIAPQISQELIKNLLDRGVIVIQNNRTPWF